MKLAWMQKQTYKNDYIRQRCKKIQMPHLLIAVATQYIFSVFWHWVMVTSICFVKWNRNDYFNIHVWIVYPSSYKFVLVIFLDKIQIIYAKYTLLNCFQNSWVGKRESKNLTNDEVLFCFVVAAKRTYSVMWKKDRRWLDQVQILNKHITTTV